jgi:uncharacterized membrane protein YsdA (DUF1294 family)
VPVPALAIGYLLVINLFAFALFGIDKRRAEAAQWRIRESTLIGVAVAGGWLGAKAGQRRFRHKTRKQPFARRLNAAGLSQLGVLMVVSALALLPTAQDAAGTSWMEEALEGLVRLLDGGAGGAAPSDGGMPRRFGPGSGDGM